LLNNEKITDMKSTHKMFGVLYFTLILMICNTAIAKETFYYNNGIQQLLFVDSTILIMYFKNDYNFKNTDSTFNKSNNIIDFFKCICKHFFS